MLDKANTIGLLKALAVLAVLVILTLPIINFLNK